jgi:hypothetical protein
MAESENGAVLKYKYGLPADHDTRIDLFLFLIGTVLFIFSVMFAMAMSWTAYHAVSIWMVMMILGPIVYLSLDKDD